jgi:hypothetical protein
MLPRDWATIDHVGIGPILTCWSIDYEPRKQVKMLKMATESGIDASPWQVVIWHEECFAIGNVLGLVGSWSVSVEQLQVRQSTKRLRQEAESRGCGVLPIGG